MRLEETRHRIAGLPALAPLPPLVREALWLPDEDAAALRAWARRAADEPRVSGMLCDAARACCAGYPVSGAADAISLLGVGGVRGALVRAVLEERFPAETLGDFPSEAFWAVSHRFGTEAERIAGHLGSRWTEHACAAAFLQDVGRLLLAQLLPEQYEKVQGTAFARGLHLLEAELEEMGADHTLAGKWLAEAWGLPRPYLEAIWLHHHAADVVAGLAQAADLLDILAIAEHLANRVESGVLPGSPPPPGVAGRLQRLGIDAEQYAAWAAACMERTPRPRALSEVLTETPAPDAEPGADRNYEALCALEAAASDAGGLPAALDAIARALRLAFAAPSGFCCCMAEDGTGIEAAIWRADSDDPEHVRVPAAKGMVLAELLSRLGGLSAVPASAQQVVALPLTAGGRAAGQACLLYGDAASTPDQEALAALHRFLGVCGRILARQKAVIEARRETEALSTALWRQEAAYRRRVQSERLSGVSQLAAGAAHEINNPLAVISGRAQILLSRSQGEEDAKALDTIVLQCRRITQILTDLMQFARPPAPRYESVRVHYLLHQVLMSLRERLAAKSIEVVEVYPEVSPRVRLDPHQMQRVFLNLFLNAEEALSRPRGPEGKRGGTLRVRVLTLQDGNAVEVRVEDDGPGIPASIIDQVFDPFFTTKDVGEGTGLGLAVCHGIVEAHGGRIAIESEPGRGTAVSVRLPAVPAHEAQNAPTSVVENLDAGAPPRPGKPRLLVAVGDDDLASILMETLRQRGFETLSARDGLEALATLATSGADALILENSLRGIAGGPLFDEVRERFRELPAIVLVGPLEEVDPAVLVRRGAQACLRKPFEMARLLAEVRAATAVRHVA